MGSYSLSYYRLYTDLQYKIDLEIELIQSIAHVEAIEEVEDDEDTVLLFGAVHSAVQYQ